MSTSRTVSYAHAQDPTDALRVLLRVRFAECLERADALHDDDDEAVHAFRLACKCLRYAIERSPKPGIDLTATAELLAAITDELGSAHDCAVLADWAAQCAAGHVARRARADRKRDLRNAVRAWRTGFAPDGAFKALAQFTGFTWPESPYRRWALRSPLRRRE